MAQFEVIATPLAGLKLIRRRCSEDSRGYFSRFFCAAELNAAGFSEPVAQINQTLTRRCGTVRGMHFQAPPHAEIKLVSCLSGRIFDVAVDLRRGSSTFLHWFGVELSAQNRESLLIPQGFAHGFQTLADDCELLYLHSTAYAPAAEGALHALEPRVAIDWPLAITEMSERDRQHPNLTSDFQGIEL
ncbi:dTDP-4-dehydrorhamnose 3,5-epimerase family protein [Methylomonas koyamae]|uniref:dTDP-4-dehydrorhamnose 3,5-epimerase family protein n=1 Tax=Methylomonas koyamae TaxID=702114 RepID=UPI002873565D|nr:dTDP-4-dehydrorhamnose 3,5-epimerase family protein [Methylomonas koyamae]WNB77132.1 dTDP-4-dehydrorhamnose 3,5-epimerase family protein [Methylomonas koyamae]